MAKKKAKRSQTPDGKVRVEVRMDKDLYAAIDGLAARIDVGLNQLLCGLSEWAAQRGIPGIPAKDEQGHIVAEEKAKCVFFGQPDIHLEAYHIEELGDGPTCMTAEEASNYHEGPADELEAWLEQRRTKVLYKRGFVHAVMDFNGRVLKPLDHEAITDEDWKVRGLWKVFPDSPRTALAPPTRT